jgi:hypothetical protein
LASIPHNEKTLVRRLTLWHASGTRAALLPTSPRNPTGISSFIAWPDFVTF